MKSLPEQASRGQRVFGTVAGAVFGVAFPRPVSTLFANRI